MLKILFLYHDCMTSRISIRGTKDNLLSNCPVLRHLRAPLFTTYLLCEKHVTRILWEQGMNQFEVKTKPSHFLQQNQIQVNGSQYPMSGTLKTYIIYMYYQE